MDDKFILMDLNDERSVKVAEVLKNKSCKKMIDFLGDVREASEKDISDACGIPLNTVGYNLKNLISVGLVEKTKNFFWSVKGKKIKMYKLARKHIIISPGRKPNLNYLKGILPVIVFALVALIVVANLGLIDLNKSEDGGFLKFESGEALLKAFEDAKGQGDGRMFKGGEMMVMEAAMDSATSAPNAVKYSETNIQVEGVDEADIIKTDGKYIYTVSGGELIIAKAYPSDEAEIVSEMDLGNFYSSEIFIDEDRLLVFGNGDYDVRAMASSKTFAPEMPYRSFGVVEVRLYDVSDRAEPELLRTIDFEGNYITSRKIGSDVYFVANSYPDLYQEDIVCSDIVPKFAEDGAEMAPMVDCVAVSYIAPIQAQSFITVASISMSDEDKEIEKEVIVGSGQNVYASTEHLYIAQTSWPVYRTGGLVNKEDSIQKTVITKFGLDGGEIEFLGTGEVTGHILNQFSMDEYEENFRIATTVSGYSDNVDTSVNNLYVLDSDLNVVGELEGVAPGESIYSVRFMGKRGYMVTFKHIDPLFVIDLSDATNPNVLGKLKIPGYSDYLHPYDETHLIGIGKEVDASIDMDKIHTEGAIYFTAIQGVKLAIFDVSDVSNPIEMYKEVIGDRGTESLATSDHKAFLFDKAKGLLVVPMTVAELNEGQEKNEQGEYVFSGAYVYDINLEEGFNLRGRVSHYEDDSDFKKSGYYFRGGSSILRSLYIGDVLYTLSPKKIGMNLLDSLEDVGEMVFSKGWDDGGEEMR